LENVMPPITVVAFPVTPVGKESELAKQFEILVAATRSEPGCIAFTAHQHPVIASRFAVVEKFADQAAFDAHLEYPHTKAFVDWVQKNNVSLNFEFWNELG
jgi:quinol monooxygenase YgiN